MSAALAHLAAEGYTEDFSAASHGVQCKHCEGTHSSEGAIVERVFRFEGASNPDDQAIVLGLRCRHCDAQGVLVTGYGPSTDPDQVSLILSLLDGR